jgi:hypothetical protein
MKKLCVTCLVVIVAFGCAGIAYAKWSQTLTVNGSVNTGSLRAIFENAVSSDGGTNLDPKDVGTWNFGTIPYSWSPTGVRASQNVGQTTTSISSSTDTLNDTLTINITNAYPGYYGSVACDVLNDGTIPVAVTATASAVTPSGVGALASNISITRIGVFAASNSPIAANAKATGYITIGIGTAAGAATDPPATGASYTFSVNLVVNQNP